MPVVDRDGHLGGVACLVGEQRSSARRPPEQRVKLPCFVERDRRAVYGDGVHVLFVNGDRLRLAVGLPVLNAGR